MLVQFEQAMYDVQEDVGTTMVCAEIALLPMGGLECDIEVTLSAMDGTKAGIYVSEAALLLCSNQFTLLCFLSSRSRLLCVGPTHSNICLRGNSGYYSLCTSIHN